MFCFGATCYHTIRYSSSIVVNKHFEYSRIFELSDSDMNIKVTHQLCCICNKSFLIFPYKIKSCESINLSFN
jgi:hypothetical protein